ncbi:MAG TPA: glycosyltransferase family 39 protein, partial [Labilithrix sp.]
MSEESDKPESTEEEKAPEAEPAAEEPPPDPDLPPALGDAGPKWLPLAVAVVLPALFFFVLPPLTRAGLWDPHELNVADLARRIALNLHGATNLALEGADNSLPHLNDLGRPQLAFSSIALGFKFFGLHEWAGRVPLALWGLVAVVVTYGWVTRLVDRRAGLFSAVALTTMPLVFVQARTMLGDITTIASFTMAFGGLAVAVFGKHEDDPKDANVRTAWLAIGVLGVVCGITSRGLLVGAGVPAFGVGAAWAISRVNGRTSDLFATAVGGCALVVGLGASALAFYVLALDKTSPTLLALMASDASADIKIVGAAIHNPGKY